MPESSNSAAGLEQRLRAAQELLFCEQVLRKSQSNVLLRCLAGAGEVQQWQHYPKDGVFDEDTGAFWYYHCHSATAQQAHDACPAEGAAVAEATPANEHGHFHCFVQPQGRDGPSYHLAAIGVDAHGQAIRLFTVNQWVTGEAPLDAARSMALLKQFDVHLDAPSYLVNRWLCAVLRLYEEPLCSLLLERDACLQQYAQAAGIALEQAFKDRSLHTTSELAIDVLQTVAILNGAQA